MSLCKKSFGFSLAEVLITLGIIGVVAAITLPTLIQNYKKMVYINQLKAGYTIVNEGFQRMMSLEQVSDIEDTELYRAVGDNGGNTDVVAAETAARKIIEKYFKNIKFISRADLRTETACNKLVGTGVRFWNLGDISKCSGNYNMQFMLPNGMYLNFYFGYPCSNSSISDEQIINNGGHMLKFCGNVWLDVNGKKSPNQWGRDGYVFIITDNGKIVPYRGREQNIWNNIMTEENMKSNILEKCNPKVSSSDGTSCAARIIELDNWKMNY